MKVIKILTNISFLLSCVSSMPGVAGAVDTEREIVIIAASYNNNDWYRRNLDSIAKQKYSNYMVKYINDCSTDNTEFLVENYIKENHLEHKIELIKNKTRMGALANVYNAIHACQDHVIIVILDADDWFTHENVLSAVNEAYKDPRVWLTYGSYEHFPYRPTKGCCKEIPQEVIRSNAFRKYTWVTAHLRTFYAWLFKEVKYEDLLYKGQFYPMAGDVAYMFPMLEMCGERFKFIPDNLYVYNIATPISDSKKNERFQLQLDAFIRNKPRYTRLNESKLKRMP